jgi:hypothetical protein
MRNVSKFLLLILVVSFVSTYVFCGEDDWLKPLGAPPRAKPRRISGGESFPPLPLPATPLRRSERKRQPSAPKLIGKVVWGAESSFSYESGAVAKVSDWNMCPDDIKQLLKKSGKFLGTPYGAETVNLANFHGDPVKTPVLFLSGGRTVKLDESQLAMLRAYILRGGMLVFDSIAGSPYFYKSAKEFSKSILPDYAIRTVPLDHPVYHMLYDIDKVSYPKNLDSDKPALEGVYIGSRMAVIISKYGLGCGWDNREVPLIEQAVYYDVDSANKIGINLISYAVGYGNVGRQEAKPELFGLIDEKRPTDEFVFAQIKHEGAWNVHPGAASALLRRMRADSALSVSLKRVAVDLQKDDISRFTFLYLTGLDMFSFSDADVAALKKFFTNAGTLLVNNGLGMKTFDASFRVQIQRVLPDAKFVLLPINHPLYSSFFEIKNSNYTPAVVKTDPKLNMPTLYGIEWNGELRVIYSQFDMEGGWLGIEYPLSRGYESYSALRLGMNILMYAATH